MSSRERLDHLRVRAPAIHSYRRWLSRCGACIAGLLSAAPVSATTGSGQVPVPGSTEPAVVVVAPRVANADPAAAWRSTITALRFDPGVEVQARGFAEAQSDLVIRGGLFENNAVNLGAVSISDPQTGHYLAELPLDPRMLTVPIILTGADSARVGLNASVATVQYELADPRPGGELAVGGGSDDLQLFDALLGHEVALENGAMLGMTAAIAQSRGDGSRAYGDHDFERYSAHFRFRLDDHRTDVLVGRQDKFFGWPGAYTGFASLPETDDTRTDLLLISHRREVSATAGWSVSAYQRRLRDDYDYDRRTRETRVRGSFEHETETLGLAGEGRVTLAGIDWRWSGQWAGEQLVGSTDLTEGTFTERNLWRLALTPTFDRVLDARNRIAVMAGLAGDWSDRDTDAVLPLAQLRWIRSLADGSALHVSLDYARTSQVPGFTALKSPPTGLFGGNTELRRELTDALVLTSTRETGQGLLRAELFFRRQMNQVDWTWSAGTPYSRQANAVDVDVVGLALAASRQWQTVGLTAGYTVLDKDAEYGDATIDASYYVLNYARQRLTLALTWTPVDAVELRLDTRISEYRDNPLRTSDRDAFQMALGVGWMTSVRGLRVDLTIDNLTDDAFEDFPGSPAPGRQASLRTSYSW